MQSISFVMAAILATTTAHMSMQFPFARNVDGNGNVYEVWEMNEPMVPVQPQVCHGLPSKAVPSGNKFAAGEVITLDIFGTVPHYGGHCSFWYSIDNENFVKIADVKDCTLNPNTTQVQIPDTLPMECADKCTFAWSWVPRVSGLCEVYSNCADIKVTGLTGKSEENPQIVNFQAIIDDELCQRVDDDTHWSELFKPLKLQGTFAPEPTKLPMSTTTEEPTTTTLAAVDPNSGNIIIENVGTSTKWWYAFRVNNVAEGYALETVSISSAESDDLSVCAVDLSSGYPLYQCSPSVGSGSFQLPLTVVVTSLVDDVVMYLEGTDVVTTFNDQAQFDLGSNFGENVVPSESTTSAPTSAAPTTVGTPTTEPTTGVPTTAAPTSIATDPTPPGDGIAVQTKGEANGWWYAGEVTGVTAGSWIEVFAIKGSGGQYFPCTPNESYGVGRVVFECASKYAMKYPLSVTVSGSEGQNYEVVDVITNRRSEKVYNLGFSCCALIDTVSPTHEPTAVPTHDGDTTTTTDASTSSAVTTTTSTTGAPTTGAPTTDTPTTAAPTTGAPMTAEPVETTTTDGSDTTTTDGSDTTTTTDSSTTTTDAPTTGAPTTGTPTTAAPTTGAPMTAEPVETTTNAPSTEPTSTTTASPTAEPTSATTTTTNTPNSDEAVDKEIIGYYASWQWYDRSKLAQPKNMDFSKVTIVNFAFFQPDANGNIFGTDSWADPQVLFGPTDWNPDDSSTERCHWSEPNKKTCGFHKLEEGLIGLVHAAGARIFPSLGGWTLSENFPGIAADPVKRANFVQQCVGLIEDYEFDGIDLDWEYPAYTDHSGTPADTENFVLLLQELRSALDAHGAITGKYYEITAAVGCGPSVIAGYDIAQSAPLLDQINLMTYDFFGGWSTVTGANAPLYDQEFPDGYTGWSVDGCVTNWIAGGATKDQLNIGLPFYGRAFANANGPNQEHDGVDKVHWTEDEGVPQYFNIELKLQDMTVQRDEKTRTQQAWFNDGTGYLSFDDEEAICNKVEYVLDEELNGFIIWELSGDVRSDLTTPLLDEVNKKLDYPQSHVCESVSG